VHPAVTTSINGSFCPGGSYSFGGTIITEAGIYHDTLTTVNGCDSIITLTLTEDSYQTATITASVCDGESYMFKGTAITAGGIYVDTLPGTGGSCDTIVTLT